MEFFIAGGVGEHGRNCFYVKGDSACFLVDCGKMAGAAQPLTGVPDSGVCFLSDPQLKMAESRELADAFLSHGGSVVMTGMPERGSYSEKLLQDGKMEFLRYPVHQNETEYRALLRKKCFSRAIPYHTPDFPVKQESFFS